MRWIGLLNCALIALILWLASSFFYPPKPANLPDFKPQVLPKELPKSLFASTDEFFSEIGVSSFTLNWVAPQMQLPDLSHELVFCGKNGRPDVVAGKSQFHLLLKSSEESAIVNEGERTYLIYKGNFSSKYPLSEHNSLEPGPLWGEPTYEPKGQNFYVFSPQNLPTPLWFEARACKNSGLEIQVGMLDEKGNYVSSPSECATLYLQQQEGVKPQLTWQIGNTKVDSTLLVRQKARWVGVDLFLNLYGGEEFSHTFGKERIDFQGEQDLYSCFISYGDNLIWKEGRWREAELGVTTVGFPLLTVKKIDEKIISFELWDPEGKSKTLLNLVRVREHHPMPNLAQEFKFVGAKTWAQFIVEAKSGERMTLKPFDWLVCTESGWIKLDTADQIDAFVANSLKGALFILEKMDKKNGKQVLIGKLFNSLRTEVSEVELPAATQPSLAHQYRPHAATPPLLPHLATAEELP